MSIVESETIARLDDENRKLILKCVQHMKQEANAKRDIYCLRQIIKNQSNKIDSFKKLFWRIYFK